MLPLANNPPLCQPLAPPHHLLLAQLVLPSPSYQSSRRHLYRSLNRLPRPHLRPSATAFPDLTSDQVQRHPRQSSAMVKQRANLRSTKPAPSLPIDDQNCLRPDRCRNSNRTLSSADRTASPPHPSPFMSISDQSVVKSTPTPPAVS
jgi:hypothetical protein